MSIRTSEIPFQAASGSAQDTVIVLAEISAGTFRLRRFPKTAFDGPQGTAGTNGTQGIQGIQGDAGTNGTNGTNGAAGTPGVNAAFQLGFAASDETTPLVAGTGKVTLRAPSAATITAVRASLTTASSSGVVTFDINVNSVSILSTKLTIDANERTSTTAAIPPVISDSSLPDDGEIVIDFDTVGTGAAGAKLWILGTY